MKVVKNNKICIISQPWDAETEGVVTYKEMILKVTGVSRPNVLVKNNPEIYLDLSDDNAVLYHPTIPEGVYISWSGEIEEFNAAYPDSIPIKHGYCPSTGGFRPGDGPYQQGGSFPIPLIKNAVVRRENNICILF